MGASPVSLPALEARTPRQELGWRRDREMMRFADAGMTNKEIGKRPGITEQWVSTLIQRRLREG